MDKNNIIILSGGMDSTTLLYEKKDKIKKAISFFYGQKHKKELDFAKYHCNKLNIDYSKTWTCYVGADTYCGVCASCTERKEALYGFDNTKYKEGIKYE
jgi:7-cyano-7-deazaguanine synthase in queuosine biosynthesis